MGKTHAPGFDSWFRYRPLLQLLIRVLGLRILQSPSHSPSLPHALKRRRRTAKTAMVGVSKDDKSEILELFLKIGLDDRTAKNTIANNKVTANLTAVIHEVVFAPATFEFWWIFLIHSPFLLNFWIFFVSFWYQCKFSFNFLFSIQFQAAVTDGCERRIGNLLYTVCYLLLDSL